MNNEEKITWTRVLLNGELVGCLDPSVTRLEGDTREERTRGRSLFDAGYRLATRGYWTRVGAGKKRNSGYLVFNCGNSLGCPDVRCNRWH